MIAEFDPRATQHHTKCWVMRGIQLAPERQDGPR
jgi:hypothetical protein